MLIRIISSIVALPLLFFFVIKGGVYLEVAACIISLIALYEFSNVLKKKYKPVVLPSYFLIPAFYLAYHYEKFVLLSGLIAIFVALILILYVFDHDKKRLHLKLEMIEKKTKKISASIEWLSLYINLEARKVTEFENEKIEIMDHFIRQNKDNFNNEDLKFSSKIKK